MSEGSVFESLLLEAETWLRLNHHPTGIARLLADFAFELKRTHVAQMNGRLEEFDRLNDKIEKLKTALWEVRPNE